MTTLEEIAQMWGYSKITCGNNPEEVKERMSDTFVYLARCNEMLADAKRVYRSKKASEIGEAIIRIAKENYLAAKAQNALVEAICSDEAFIVDSLDRLSATLTHQLDGLRSLLSYEKEAQRLSRSGY